MKLQIKKQKAKGTAPGNRIQAGDSLRSIQVPGNEALSPLFLAVVKATEEAIDNSLLRATPITGRDGHRAEALPIERTVEILKKYGALKERR